MSEVKKKGKWDSSDEESENDAQSRKRAKKGSTGNDKPSLKEVRPTDDEKPSEDAAVIDVQPIAASMEEVEPVLAEAPLDVSEGTLDQDDDISTGAAIERPPVHNPIFDGCRSVDCYQLVNFIDQGTYGMVFKARCRETGELYALKQIKFGPETNKVGFPITALREINILLALQHPNIVRVKEMVVGSSIDKIYMVMEYCENDLKMCMKTSKQSFSTAEVHRTRDVVYRSNHQHLRSVFPTVDAYAHIFLPH
jgi:cell division cycle 2-like protein